MNLTACSLFSPWTDPVSGITSYILTKRVAPIQQSFYFTNQTFSDDGRYLWFYTAHPPAGNGETGRTLGVADLSRETVCGFPETQFRSASPFVDGNTGSIYWCWDYAVYSRGPNAGDQPVLVNTVPERIHKNRPGNRLATHLTRSADGKEFFIDAQFGREWCAGSLPIHGGEFEVWQTFDRCYNHAQFSPRDPDLALIAQDYWVDVVTGIRHRYENRLWLIRRGERARPLLDRADSHGHESWDADGQHIWYVDYEKGTEKVNIETGKKLTIWPNGAWHSHASRDGHYLVGDIGGIFWEKTVCRVAFFNIATGKEINIVSQLPLPCLPRTLYHIHPHPQFCVRDTLIAYTTTVMGKVDVAVVNTEDLIQATR